MNFVLALRLFLVLCGWRERLWAEGHFVRCKPWHDSVACKDYGPPLKFSEEPFRDESRWNLEEELTPLTLQAV